VKSISDTAILVITGPTASGKTERALSMARNDSTIEIVNADASLLYRGFDIGTAKPSKEVLAEVPHHLVDILDPNEQFSAGEYSLRARNTLREILARNKTPIVVGGTAFYIDALFRGIASITLTKEEMERSRRQAQEAIQQEGFDVMHERLKAIDPELYLQIQRERNPIRLERAWAHYYATGEPLGETRKQLPDSFEYQPDYRVLSVPRPELWKRIESRVDAMLASGWLKEARSLSQRGVTREMPAMRAIGYSELFDVIEGKQSLDKARELITIRTRQYAKRQVTWMKRYGDGKA
jgi:tRNA dimethylallyltransferase